jgi:hypothetical protein
MTRRPDPLPRGAIPLRERLTLFEQWQAFVKDIGLDHPRVTELQRREMRRAFYSGAATFFSLLISDTDGGVEASELDVAYVESLFQELQHFKRMIARGEA